MKESTSTAERERAEQQSTSRAKQTGRTTSISASSSRETQTILREAGAARIRETTSTRTTSTQDYKQKNSTQDTQSKSSSFASESSVSPSDFFLYDSEDSTGDQENLEIKLHARVEAAERHRRQFQKSVEGWVFKQVKKLKTNKIDAKTGEGLVEREALEKWIRAGNYFGLGFDSVEEGEDLLTKMKLDDEHLSSTLNQIEVVLDKDSATSSSGTSIAQMEQASQINSVEIEMEDLRSTIEANRQSLSSTRNPFAVSSWRRKSCGVLFFKSTTSVFASRR
ncbi:unnamed protein product [Amoebophrya sp. A120]|nr:unnamed protein product [Amoebophrya sp. A120]|eukprot:GSA120T00008594001.1